MKRVDDLREALKLALENEQATRAANREAMEQVKLVRIELAQATCPFTVGEKIKVNPRVCRGMKTALVESVVMGYGGEDYLLRVRPIRLDGEPSKLCFLLGDISKVEEMNGKVA